MLVTFATDPTKITLFPKSSSTASTEEPPLLTNLGLNRPWRGFIDRLDHLRTHLRTLPSDTIVAFTDAYDAVITAPLTTFESELTHRFRAHNTDILFSAETSCYPWSHVADMYPLSPTKYRFINAGGYVGYAGALLNILEAGDPSQSPCDQAYFTYYYINRLQNPTKTGPRIKLDVYQTIFQTAYGVPWSEFEIRSGSPVTASPASPASPASTASTASTLTPFLYNIETGTQPLLIHFNGNQFLREDNTSIIPILHDILTTRPMSTKQLLPATPAQKYPTVFFPRDAEIIALAESRAARYVAPNSDTIRNRDRDNFHAILEFAPAASAPAASAPAAPSFSPIPEEDRKTPRGEWEHTNRQIVESYFRFVFDSFILPDSSTKTAPKYIDVSLHDFVGHKMNTLDYPHSIASFSTLHSDTHNILIPDLYAMQHYNGKLTIDEQPTLKKQNRALFIGSSTGPADITTNQRVRLCRAAQTIDWLDAYISDIVNFAYDNEDAMRVLLPLTHSRMTIPQQREYRHILCVDGNTACWDRLPWVLASNCVCWKMESEHVCWYYPFLEPWVHYVPFTLDTLEETWRRVSGDLPGQLRMVQAANQFVKDFLRPEAHALYTRRLCLINPYR